MVTSTIRAKAIDSNGAESNWGSLTVTMPRDKTVSNNMFLQKMLERFTLLHRFLNFIR